MTGREQAQAIIDGETRKVSVRKRNIARQSVYSILPCPSGAEEILALIPTTLKVELTGKQLMLVANAINRSYWSGRKAEETFLRKEWSNGPTW